MMNHPLSSFGIESPTAKYRYFKVNDIYYAENVGIQITPGVAPTPGGLSASKLTKVRNLNPHILLRMKQHGVSEKMIDIAIKKGEKLWDPKNKSIVYILKDGFASGKSLLVATNPITGNPKTVIRGNYNKLKSSRFKPVSNKTFE